MIFADQSSANDSHLNLSWHDPCLVVKLDQPRSTKINRDSKEKNTKKICKG